MGAVLGASREGYEVMQGGMEQGRHGQAGYRMHIFFPD